MTLTAADLQALTDELLRLTRQQTEALETATYLVMSKSESTAYDERHERIAQLGKVLKRS